MNRRNFLKYALTVAAAALLPQTARQEFPRLPVFTLDPEQMGRSLMQGYANGIYPLEGPIYGSDDGRITWHVLPSTVGLGNDDPNLSLHV